jgi:hypothetical protein
MLPEGTCPKVTTLGLKQVNDTVNLEPDLIGKYVERLLQERWTISKAHRQHRYRVPAETRADLIGLGHGRVYRGCA